MENEEFFNLLQSNAAGNLLVFSRVLGIFAFNPVFQRRNVPTIIKAGASLALSLLIASTLGNVEVKVDSFGQYAMLILFNGFIGFVLGFLTQLFLSTLLVSGDLMDTQSGLGMAKIYDPSSGIHMPLFGTIATYMFIFYFFATNSHLSYIKIFALSFDAIPITGKIINTDLGWVITEYFGTVLELAIKLTLPFTVALMLMEISMGILTKTVPQIQVMAVNIQVKMLFMLVLMLLLAEPMGKFIQSYIDTLMQSLKGVTELIAK